MSPQTLHRRDVEAAAAVLEKAGRRVNDRGWARTGLARTPLGRPCSSLDGRAVRWSLLGAVHYELEQRGYGKHKDDRVYRHVLGALERARPGWRAWHETPGRKARETAALAHKAAKLLGRESSHEYERA